MREGKITKLDLQIESSGSPLSAKEMLRDEELGCCWTQDNSEWFEVNFSAMSREMCALFTMAY